LSALITVSSEPVTFVENEGGNLKVGGITPTTVSSAVFAFLASEQLL